MKFCNPIVQTEFFPSFKRKTLNRDKEQMYSLLISNSVIEISDK
jgi:hypothetical protein